MHITLTGNLGSGKSTICKILESEHQYEIYSTGKVQRKLAEELGISVLEMNQLMCTDAKYDHMIDDTTAKISRENPNKAIVFDSRLAWNFVETSFKVFLSVSLEVAAKRVFSDNRGNVEKYATEEDTRNKLKLRAQTEDARYKDIYHIDYFNFSNYDLILDSTYATTELLARVILTEASKARHEDKSQKPMILMSPKRLGAAAKAVNMELKDYYLEGDIQIRKTEDDYEVVQGLDIVNKAAKEGIPFVRVTL